MRVKIAVAGVGRVPDGNAQAPEGMDCNVRDVVEYGTTARRPSYTTEFG